MIFYSRQEVKDEIGDAAYNASVDLLFFAWSSSEAFDDAYSTVMLEHGDSALDIMIADASQQHDQGMIP